MINNILSFISIFGLFLFPILFGTPVVLIILLARYLLQNKREIVRLRLEVGKLADELEQMRKQKGNEDNDSPDTSG